MCDFSDDDELPDISFTPERLSNSILKDKNPSITKKHSTPTFNHNVKISTGSPTLFKKFADGIRNINELSPQQTSPGFSGKKKWKRLSPTSSYLSRLQNKSFTNSPSPTFTSSPSPPNKRVLSESPKSNLLQRCFQKLNGGILLTPNQAEVVNNRENSKEINNFDLDESVPLSWNARNISPQRYSSSLTPSPQSQGKKHENQKQVPNKNVLTSPNANSSTFKSDIIYFRNASNISSQSYSSTLTPGPLSKLKKNEEKIPVPHKNVLLSPNTYSSTSQIKPFYFTSQENKSTPVTSQIKPFYFTSQENKSTPVTPPTRKKKFGIESSPGSDLLERCLKRLGSNDGDDLIKENIKDNNGDKKGLHGDNISILTPGSILDIKKHISFKNDTESVVNNNKVNTENKIFLSFPSSVSDKKMNACHLKTKVGNLDSNVKSWMEDYEVQSGAFNNEKMLGILDETTKARNKKPRKNTAFNHQHSQGNKAKPMQLVLREQMLLENKIESTAKLTPIFTPFKIDKPELDRQIYMMPHIFPPINEENVINTNEVNTKSIESSRVQSPVAEYKYGTLNLQTKIGNLDSNVKSQIEESKLKSRYASAVYDKKMLSIIDETTKKSRCNCKGDCRRKQCSCQRSQTPCGTHCGCQHLVCKNKISVPSPSTPRLPITMNDSPPSLSISRHKSQLLIIESQIKEESIRQKPQVKIVENPYKKEFKERQRRKGIKTPQDEIAVQSTLKCEVPSPSIENVAIYNGSSNSPLTSLNVVRNTVRVIKTPQNEVSIHGTSNSDAPSPYVGNVVIYHRESHNLRKPVSIHPSTTRGVTSFVGEVESPLYNGIILPNTAETESPLNDDKILYASHLNENTNLPHTADTETPLNNDKILYESHLNEKTILSHVAKTELPLNEETMLYKSHLNEETTLSHAFETGTHLTEETILYESFLNDNTTLSHAVGTKIPLNEDTILYESRLNEDTILLPATEPVNINESSSFSNESVACNKPSDNILNCDGYKTKSLKELENKSEISPDCLSGTPLILVPESLNILRNSYESENTFTNSRNDLLVNDKTKPVPDILDQQSKALLSQMDLNISHNIPNTVTYSDILKNNAGESYTGIMETNSSNHNDIAVSPIKPNSSSEVLDNRKDDHNMNIVPVIKSEQNLEILKMNTDNHNIESDANCEILNNCISSAVPIIRSEPVLFQLSSDQQITRPDLTRIIEDARVCNRKTSSDDLGYGSDTQPPIKKIKLGAPIRDNIRTEVNQEKSWDQIKQETTTSCEIDSGKSWDQIKQEINSNTTHTSGHSSNIWHRPQTTRSTLMDSDPVIIKQEPSLPAILPATLVFNLLVCSDFKGTKVNLLNYNNFIPSALDKVIKENPLLFKQTDSEVILEPNISKCGGHSGPVGCRSRATCSALHICSNFVEGNCSDEACVYGHSFNTNHNKGILKRSYLENVDAGLLCKLLKSVVNVSEPKDLLDICKSYNNSGCTIHNCNNLHVCFSLVIGKFKCGRVNCSLNHNILDEKCRELLLKAGIDTNESPRDVMAELLTINPSISEKFSQ